MASVGPTENSYFSHSPQNTISKHKHHFKTLLFQYEKLEALFFKKKKKKKH